MNKGTFLIRSTTPALLRFYALLMREVMSGLSATIQTHDLSPAQISTLFRLRQSSLLVSEVGQQLGLTSGTTSYLVERLVQKGLAERLEASSDRRQRRVRLTAEGRAFLTKFERGLDQVLGNLMKDVPEPLLKRLNEVLVEVLQLVE